MLAPKLSLFLLSFSWFLWVTSHSFVIKPRESVMIQFGQRRPLASSADDESVSDRPTTFREAEVLGLNLMQDGQYEQALKVFQNGLRLPGSRADVVRTKSLSGPSPVGGSFGGLETQRVQNLDEFELQAAHYNMACAMAQLGRMDDAMGALEIALQNGFDNYATVRSDPDLEPLQSLADFDKLLQKYEPNRGFNPFELFQKNKK